MLATGPSLRALPPPAPRRLPTVLVAWLRAGCR
ncbi:MAG: hypothetical protein J07HX5_01446, partial [halophilic archaeon J07HX5]